jgi:hypothetical protein
MGSKDDKAKAKAEERAQREHDANAKSDKERQDFLDDLQKAIDRKNKDNGK